uniref:eEF-1B gamma n=1 Tax=Romanomermis culicivorax TaxID=13658 RepID=A0A915JIK5_ROMCU
TLHASPNNFRTFEVLIAAKYGQSNVKVEYSDKPVASQKFPFAKLPCFETSNGKTLTGSHAIAKYVAQKALQNAGADHQSACEAEILHWFQLVDNEIVPNVLAWLLPSVSAMTYDNQQVEEAKLATMHILKILDQYLLPKTFLVGERLTLADVAVSCALLPAFEHLLEPDHRRHMANLTRWFYTCIYQPNFKAILGDVHLCAKSSQFDVQKFKKFQQDTTAFAAIGEKAAHKKEEKPKKEAAKKDTKPKEEKKPAAKPAAEEEMDDTEQALAQEPKQNDPFAIMPKGTFNMDEFKRVYSNEDTETKALPYFWQNFDKENYSIWYCEYKYADELTLTFMSCNLIAGMFQRLDKLRKNAFASMCLFGTDNNSTISGIWVWRGHELAFNLSDDWKVDYESYNWKKLDATSAETKTLVDEYFKWEGKFDGKKFNQGKIFK